MSVLLGWMTAIGLGLAWPWITRLARAIDVAQRRSEAKWKADDLDALRRLYERTGEP